MSSWTVALAVLLLVASAAGHGYARDEGGPIVDNVFMEQDLRTALQDVAQQTGVNIVLDPTVNGTVSVDLDGVPLEEALRLMLMSGGYVFRKMDPNCYLVSIGDPQSPTFNLMSETRMIPLRYIKPENAEALLLSDYYKDYVKLDPVRNVVCATGPRAIIDRIADDIACLDVQPGQVLIEAVIIDVQTDRAKEFLVNWRLTEGVADPEETRTISFEGLTLGYTSLHMRELLFALRALITNGIARVRAEPSVTTLDGEQAEMFVGKEEYFSISTSGDYAYPYYRLESVKSGIVLQVLPRLVGKNLVTLKFSPEVSDVVARGEEGLPVVSRRRVTTTVRVGDGETVVVGGLASELMRKEKSGVPLLRDLPIIGTLFSRTESSHRREEVVVLLTPHIIRGPGLTPVSAHELARPDSLLPRLDPKPEEVTATSPEPTAGATVSVTERIEAVVPSALVNTEEASTAGGQQVENARTEVIGPTIAAAQDGDVPAPVASHQGIVTAAEVGTQGQPAPSVPVSALSPSTQHQSPRVASAAELARAPAASPDLLSLGPAVPPESPASSEPRRKATTPSPRRPAPSREPAVVIAAPQADTIAQPGDVIKVAISVTSLEKVKRVWLYVNGAAYGEVSGAPYETKWNTGSLPEGKHKLTAFVHLASGEWLQSEPVWIELVSDEDA